MHQGATAGWEFGRTAQRFVRVRNAKLPLSIFLAVGVANGLPSTDLWAGAALLLLTYGFVVVFNDLNDAPADRINGRDLPLATGDLTDRDAEHILLGLGMLALALLVWWGRPTAALAVVFMSSVGFAYSDRSLRLSDRGMIGPIFLALAYVATPLVLVAPLVDASIAEAGTVLVVGLPFAVATSTYKDFGDELGDRATGKITPLLRYGADRVGLIATHLQMVSIAVATAMIGPGWWALPAALGLVLSTRMHTRWRAQIVVVHRFTTTTTVAMLAAVQLS